jgi:Domain of unknown function (DUF4411)
VKIDFAKGADGWLIAYARIHSRIVVTHEARNPAKTTKVPIPNVCDAFDVQPINTFEMLRRLGVAFQ